MTAMKRTAQPIGLTMGDAAGIGPEIIARLIVEGLPHPAVVYGDAGALRRALALIGAAQDWHVEEVEQPVCTPKGVIAVLNRWQALPEDLPYGEVHALAGRGAYEYLCHAIDDAQAGLIRAIVTAPLNKLAMQKGGIDAPGHTEILAERSHTEHYAMMLANEHLRSILVTIHEPLVRVPSLITTERVLQTIRLAQLACTQAGIAKPRVAVAGLNPHAGEGGKFGSEDIEQITPAIEQACAEGIQASGPWPGDTIFMRARQGEFDIVVAQYHDQGLIPIKLLGLDEGVNVTVGLPFIRTSVDHGTAYDIAGQGKADASSLGYAYRMALSMSAHQA